MFQCLERGIERIVKFLFKWSGVQIGFLGGKYGWDVIWGEVRGIDDFCVKGY